MTFPNVSIAHEQTLRVLLTRKTMQSTQLHLLERYSQTILSPVHVFTGGGPTAPHAGRQTCDATAGSLADVHETPLGYWGATIFSGPFRSDRQKQEQRHLLLSQ